MRGKLYRTLKKDVAFDLSLTLIKRNRSLLYYQKDPHWKQKDHSKLTLLETFLGPKHYYKKGAKMNEKIRDFAIYSGHLRNSKKRLKSTYKFFVRAKYCQQQLQAQIFFVCALGNQEFFFCLLKISRLFYGGQKSFCFLQKRVKQILSLQHPSFFFCKYHFNLVRFLEGNFWMDMVWVTQSTKKGPFSIDCNQDVCWVNTNFVIDCWEGGRRPRDGLQVTAADDDGQSFLFLWLFMALLIGPLIDVDPLVCWPQTGYAFH